MEEYNIAFSNMQNSFDTFVVCIGVFISLLGLFIGLLSFLNFKSVENSKKELKEHDKKISDLEAKFKEQIENQKKDFQKQIEEAIKKERQDFSTRFRMAAGR